MEGYIIPAVSVIAIGVFTWLRMQGIEGRVAPYRESLIAKDFYTLVQPQSDRPIFIWILRTFNEESRLYRMIQYFHTNYGLRQIIIIPNESKVSLSNEVPILEFFQTTEIAMAIQQATHIFSEPGVLEAASKTAQQAKKPLFLFIHDEESNKEFRAAKTICEDTCILYTNRVIQQYYIENTRQSFQFYLPVFMKEQQTHTTREKITCFCVNSQWKFQRIAAKLPAYTFLYAKRVSRRPFFTETGVLCILDSSTPYEIVLQAAASGIPIVAQWGPVLKEVLKEYCIYIQGEGVDEWIGILTRLKEDALFYRGQSQKSVKLSQLYDSPKEMDVLINFLKAS